MEIWKLLILFLCAFLGGTTIFLVRSDKSQLLKLILSFSGAYLFAITVLHLIPDAYHGGEHENIKSLKVWNMDISTSTMKVRCSHGEL
jgi:zinc and cadmium transporter